METVRSIWVCIVIASVAGCAANGKITVRKDPFAGEQRGFTLYLDPGHYSAVSLNEASGKIALDVLVVQRGISELRGHPGDKGEFKIGDEIVALESATEVKPVSNVRGYQVFTQWIVRYMLTAEQAAHFAKGPLVAVKVAISETTLQIALAASHAKKFQANVAEMTAGSTVSAK